MPNLRYSVDQSNAYRLLKPTGTGMVDVVSDFAWTASPKESRRDAPRAHLIEYQQNGGQLIAAMIYYGRVLSNIPTVGAVNTFIGTADPAEVYKFKYIADPTGWQYSLPFFSQTHTNRGNGFGQEDGSNPFSSILKVGEQLKGYGHGGSGRGGKLASGLATVNMWTEAALGVISSALPGKISFENPKNWSNTDEESISIQFHLLNTGTVEDVVNNRNLAHILRYNNTPSRRNFAIVDPPVIYSLSIPDIINLPACYMSNLTITDMGNTRIMDLGDGKKKTIPEAYGFNMTFSSLLMPTRNILQSLDKGETVEAISSAGDLAALAKTVFNAATSSTDKQISPNDQQEIDSFRTRTGI